VVDLIALGLYLLVITVFVICLVITGRYYYAKGIISGRGYLARNLPKLFKAGVDDSVYVSEILFRNMDQRLIKYPVKIILKTKTGERELLKEQANLVQIYLMGIYGMFEVVVGQIVANSENEKELTIAIGLHHIMNRDKIHLLSKQSFET
jgi:hypothetical protein